MGLVRSITAPLRKPAREPFSGTDSGCQKIFAALADGRGEPPCPTLSAKERCETLYSKVYEGNSDCNCDRAFFELARACLTCRSKFAPVLACTAASYIPPYEPTNIHTFREVMKTADIPKWTVRDTDDNLDHTSAQQSSRGWTAAQILTLVGIVLCLAFAIRLLYQSGRLSRLTSALPSMRRSRHAMDDPGSGGLRHAPDAESTPMINPVLHWRSFSPNTNRKHSRTRMGIGVLTPAFLKCISSIRRSFRWGPIKVSRVPVPDTFDLEDPATQADPFDTPSTSSRPRRNGPPADERNSGSTLDRIPYPYEQINMPSWSSAALESVLVNGQENYEDIGNVFEDDGVNDHDYGLDDGNRVMLISRNGENFSLSGSTTSLPFSRRSNEVDRRSTEVVPPSPSTTRKHAFRRNPTIARSASTPLLCPPSSEKSRIRPFSPSTDDLPNFRLHPIPKSSFLSPTHFSKPAASSGVKRSRKDPPGIHLFTTAAPPIDRGSVGLSPYGSHVANMAPTRAWAPNTYSRLAPTGCSPSSSPDLQKYIPPSPRRSPPGSTYCLPPSPLPVLKRINASDPQNLIPPVVRSVGYNPYQQHARSVSAFE